MLLEVMALGAGDKRLAYIGSTFWMQGINSLHKIAECALRLNVNVTWAGRDIHLKGAKCWQLQSKCSVDGKRAHGSVIEQDAKAVWLLAVELLEFATALRPWGPNITLHKWCTRNKRKEAWCALGYGRAWGARVLWKCGGWIRNYQQKNDLTENGDKSTIIQRRHCVMCSCVEKANIFQGV